MKIFIRKGLCLFPNLHEARAFEGSEPRFSVNYLLEPDHPAIREINKAMETVAKEKWGDKGEATLKSLRAAGKVCLRDGDTKESEIFHGKFFVSASSKTRPKVVDRDGVTELEVADGRPYSGCYISGYVDIWAMDNKFGKRIVASLGGVQFHAHGEPFTGGSGKPDEFQAIEDDEESLA